MQLYIFMKKNIKVNYFKNFEIYLLFITYSSTIF
jgi:hypothetical protein